MLLFMKVDSKFLPLVRKDSPQIRRLLSQFRGFEKLPLRATEDIKQLYSMASSDRWMKPDEALGFLFVCADW